jgi:hypothetical protein
VKRDHEEKVEVASVADHFRGCAMPSPIAFKTVYTAMKQYKERPRRAGSAMHGQTLPNTAACGLGDCRRAL